MQEQQALETEPKAFVAYAYEADNRSLVDDSLQQCTGPALTPSTHLRTHGFASLGDASSRFGPEGNNAMIAVSASEPGCLAKDSPAEPMAEQATPSLIPSSDMLVYSGACAKIPKADSARSPRQCTGCPASSPTHLVSVSAVQGCPEHGISGLYSSRSLSLSGPEGDLLEELLGPDTGGASPSVGIPEVMMPTPLCADALVQEATSDGSKPPHPVVLVGATTDSACGGKQEDASGEGLKPPPNGELLPLRFSPPHHPGLQVGHAAGGALGGAVASATPSPDGLGAGSPRAGLTAPQHLTPGFDAHELLPATRSSPAPGAWALPRISDAASPMHIDTHTRLVGRASVSTGGAAAASAGSAGCGSASATAVQPSPPVPPQASKRVRQQHSELPAAAAGAVSKPGPTGPHVLAPADSAPTAPPCSPTSQKRSSSDPASTSAGGGAGAFTYGGACTYPYPPYPYPYPPAPYGDSYYHYGYMYPPPHMPMPMVGADSRLAAYPQPADPTASHMLHYPGLMPPRHRLYRRYVSALPGRRDWIAPPGFSFPSGVESAPRTGSVPLGALATTSAPFVSGVGPLAPAASAEGGRAADGRIRLAAGNITLEWPRSAAAPTAFGDVDLESAKAARACHEQFAADQVPLPLPCSTVDSIRQELCAMTQELLQRRGGQAQVHTEQLRAPADATMETGPLLQEAKSWTPGDTASSVPSLLAPSSARYAMGTQPSAFGPAALHHAMALDSLAVGAPVQPEQRQDESSSRARMSACRTFSLPDGRSLPYPGSGLEGASALVGHGTDSAPAKALESLSSDRAFADAPVTTHQPHHGGHGISSSAGVPSSVPSAMRRLFPPPSSTNKHAAPLGYGPAISKPAPAAGPKPRMAMAAAASAPLLGPRPSMSGRSGVSVSHSASVAQAAPTRAGKHHMHRRSGGGAAQLTPCCVGQQGSRAVEAEDDGEEVHGPPQRCSASRPLGSAAGSAAPVAVPVGERPPAVEHFASGRLHGTYDYQPGHYHPGYYYYRPPPGTPAVPQGYRGLPAYSMPPPSGVPHMVGPEHVGATRAQAVPGPADGAASGKGER